MKKRDIGLVPLRNFALVDEKKQIYRSAQPLYGYEYRWLSKMLGIKQIFNLRTEEIDARLTTGLGIGVETISIPDRGVPTLKQALDFMDEIRKIKVPSLIHCTHGHGRTSTFSVLVRIAIGWDVHDAIKEEKIKFHYEFAHPLQEEFLIKNFGG